MSATPSMSEPHLRVLFALARLVPAGKVTTYKALAEVAYGSAGAARAVGTALATNPWPVVVPCHRVVRADHALGGFNGATDLASFELGVKTSLLRGEGVPPSARGIVPAAHVLATATAFADVARAQCAAADTATLRAFEAACVKQYAAFLAGGTAEAALITKMKAGEKAK